MEESAMTIVEKRKKTIISTTYFIMLLAAYYFFVKYAFWLVAPFIFSLLIAMALQKPVRIVSEKTHIKKNIVSVLAVLLILAALLGILIFAGYRIVTELQGFSAYLLQKIQDLPTFVKDFELWFNNAISALPDKMEATARSAVSSMVDTILLGLEDGFKLSETQITDSSLPFDISMLAGPLGGLWSTAKQIPSMLLAVLIGIISCFFMTSDYDNLTKLIKKNISVEREAAIVRTKRLMIDSMGKMVRSYCIIIVITACEIALGLNFLKLIGVYSGSYILAISIITSLLDILPVLGTGTVFIPWGIYCLISGDVGLGIGILVLYVVILVVRQIVEPRLVAMNLGLPPVLTLMGMYIGIQLFGVLGLFIVPLTFVLVKILNSEGLIQLWTPRERVKATPIKKIDQKK